MKCKTENIEMLTYEEYCILSTALRREDQVMREIGEQRGVEIMKQIRQKVKVLVPEELR